MNEIDLTALKGTIFRYFKGDLYLLLDIIEEFEMKRYLEKLVI